MINWFRRRKENKPRLTVGEWWPRDVFDAHQCVWHATEYLRKRERLTEEARTVLMQARQDLNDNIESLCRYPNVERSQA